MPMVVGCEEQLTICYDEDLFVYLTSIDRENHRCLVLVEETSRSDQLKKLSRVGISSIGMTYEVLEGNDDEIRPNAITLYVEDGQANAHKVVIEEENDDDTRGDDCMDTDAAVETDTTAETDTAAEMNNAAETDTGADMDTDLADKYIEQPPVETN
ncbi:hypothetical protein N665_1015s0004 [Sinapis alba]|nr:hypothetical protein N665_1015s0004 [Sinapis alba]